jgi:hypothetical protein
MPKLITVILAGAGSCILFMVLHATDWQRIFGRHPRPPWTYVAGVLGLTIPYAAVMALWGDWWAICAAAATVVGGGGAVLFGYKVRGQGPVILGGQDSEAIIRMLRERNRELEEKLMALEEGGCQKEEGYIRPQG